MVKFGLTLSEKEDIETFNEFREDCKISGKMLNREVLRLIRESKKNREQETALKELLDSQKEILGKLDKLEHLSLIENRLAIIEGTKKLQESNNVFSDMFRKIFRPKEAVLCN